MRTEFGELRVLDGHAHFFSHRLFCTYVGLLKGQLPRDDPYGALEKKLGWELPGKDPKELAARWVAEMDSHGVERMVLLPGVVGDEESVSTAIKAYPERFTGYVMIDPTQDDAVSRAHRALTDLGLQGIALFPAMHHFYAWDERFFPVYEEASRQGVPVFIHFGLLKMAIRHRLGIPSKFDMRFSNPLDLSLPAREFPQVRFIIPHFGCGFFRETLMLGSLCENVFVDTSSSNSWITVTPGIKDLTEVFAKTLQVFGACRILFGTDSTYFPRGWRKDVFDSQLLCLKKLLAPSNDMGLIFGENLVRLHALKSLQLR